MENILISGMHNAKDLSQRLWIHIPFYFNALTGRIKQAQHCGRMQLEPAIQLKLGCRQR
jgi:hypothetical protein